MSANVVDYQARDRALDPARSFIVQAPAGSGKTGLLIQRFLALLPTVEEPEDIVAITFTRKAAGEIRQRVLTALDRASRGEEGHDPHERKTLELAQAALEHAESRHWAITRDPRRLQARTIDSFCESLVRGRPLSSGMGGYARTVDDARAYYYEAARRILRESRPAVTKILRHLDNELPNLRRMVSRMLARRDQWTRHVADLRGDLRDRLEQGLRDVAIEALTALRERMPEDLRRELEGLAPYAAENVPSDPRIGQLTSLPESAEASTLVRWQGVAELFLTKPGKVRKTVNIKQGFPAASTGHVAGQMKERAVACLSIVGDPDHGDFLETLAEVKDLPPVSYTDDQWELIEGLIELLVDAVSTLHEVFAESGEVDHVEVSVSAARSMEDGKDRPRVQHLLVDEFQDTSTSQYRLIEQVMAGSNGLDGRTLFLVGDPMQSIYRFREAEVALFLRAWQGRLGQVQLEQLTLQVNFRCRSAVIDSVNEIFDRVLPQQPDFDRGAVPYTPFQCFHDDEEGCVTHQTWVNSDLDLEAHYVVERIREAKDADMESIAILARNRHHLGRILDLLREVKIPFRAVEFEQLQDRPVVRDLRALTSVLLLPADRIAWLSVLRAPWCGLSLEDLFVVAELKDRLIPEALEDPETVARLSADGKKRALRVMSIVSEARANRQRASVREEVRNLWVSLGGPALVNATAREDAEVYLDLIATMESGGDIDDLTRVDRRLEELYSKPDLDADGSLEIMTIHRAKGLEFDCVIVPGLGRYSRGEPRQLLQWQERFGHQSEQGRLVLGPLEARASTEIDPVRLYLQRMDNRKSKNELRRLLYVAATRAKKRLHFLGQLDLRKRDGQLAPDPRSPLAALWDGVEEIYMGLATQLELPDLEQEPERSPHPPIRRIANDWSPPPAAESVGIEPLMQERASDGEEAASIHRTASASARTVGIVVHRFLERIGDEGVDHWSPERLKEVGPSIRAALSSEGTPSAECDAATAEVVELLSNTLTDETGRWILTSHEAAESEMAVTAHLDRAIVESRIDRTFVDGGVRWVIDYKTARHEGGNVERFLREEYERYESQLELYRSVLTALDPDTPVKTALYFPRFQRLVESAPEVSEATEEQGDESGALVQGDLF